MTLSTTLNEIKSHNPCENGWVTLLKHLNKTKADGAKLKYSVILESNGIQYAIWALKRNEKSLPVLKRFAYLCAEEVRPLMKDKRSTDCLDATRDFLDGKIQFDELKKHRDASYAASASASYADADAASASAASASASARDKMRETQKEILLKLLEEN